MVTVAAEVVVAVTIPASLGDPEREPDRDRREFRLLIVPNWVGAKRFRLRSGRGGGGGIALGFTFADEIAALLLVVVVVGVVFTGRGERPTRVEEDEGTGTTEPFSRLADIF